MDVESNSPIRVSIFSPNDLLKKLRTAHRIKQKNAEISTPISTPISHSKSRSKAHPISNQRQLQSPFVSPKGSVDDNCKSPSPSSPIFQSPPHSTKLLRTRSLGLISSLEKDILDSPNFFVMHSISPPKTPLYTPSNKNNLILRKIIFHIISFLTIS